MSEAAAKAAYSQYNANRPIHCNREPSWEELTEGTREFWRAKVGMTQPVSVSSLNQEVKEMTDADRALVASDHAASGVDGPPGFDHGERFTPGPWAVADKGYGWDHFAAILAPSGIVANCRIAALSREHSQTAADARLIAAAPDLYSALSNLLESMMGGRDPDDDALMDAFDALAKVRGEA